MAEMLDDTCGFLVSPGDVLGLAAALTSVLAMGDPERTQIKGAARQRVKDRFDNSVIIPRLLDVYHETSDSYRTRC
jgi:glycosyltransferase involved in cell wall biosynthesis